MYQNTALKKIIQIILFLIMVINHAYASEKKNVLILNSYHQGYRWTDDEMRGILSGLFPVNESIKIYIEYMGTKWTFSNDYFRHLSVLYKKKFRDTGFDVIISTDDDAFNFLKQYRNEVFGTVPVVFCGLNWLEPGRLGNMKNVTGVNEATDISLNIYLMLKLHPEVEKIFIIIDSTTTGKAVYKKLNEIIPYLHERVGVIPLYDIKKEELIKRLAGLGKESLVLLALFNRDSGGEFFEYNEYCRMISDNSSVPVYGLWDFTLGYGIVGGNMASGYSQGFKAGNIAIRLLKGENADSIPVVMESPNKYMFDFIQMKRFGIDRNELPAESIVINEPSSFYSVNKRIFQVILAVTSALAVFSVILVLNIRRRYSAEKRLSESVEKYSTLVNNLNVGVFRSSVEPDGHFIQVNPAMLKIFGYGPEENFLNFPVKDLYSDTADRERFLNEIKSSKTVRNCDFLMKKKDGTFISVSITGSAAFNDIDGRLKWIDGILEDVTEKKKMEQEHRHAQKMEAIGTLASGVAHDFNNALGGLVGIISILDNKLRSGLPIPHEKLFEYINIMRESGEKGVAMVHRLLAIARKKDAEYSPVDLNAVVKRVVELLVGAVDKTITVNPVYYGKNATIFADASQVEQVLLNLCINAGHAMTIMKSSCNEWGGTLAIIVNRIQGDKYLFPELSGSSEKEFWCISVTDTGVGMQEDVRCRIFEPFFTTKGEGFGTGLGLSMVKKIVTEHNGFIDVYSEPGTGTTFKVYLPVSHEEPDHVEIPEVNVFPMGEGLILVVDDEPVMLKVACEILRECGYETVTAENGSDAVKIFSERHREIAVVVMDMAMPVMSGITAYREMRNIDPSVKVLITSGFRQDVRVRDVLGMGADGFIEKPYTLEKIAYALKDVIEKDK
ncbi:MAG TPA: ABC transporter substrate binding protein [Spirochaetota bacterium]|nr:ABC transporter substrate binding protein [Spirochaetota bacterium]